MATLGEMATLVRSKNAGPFVLTFDILFEDRATWERVRASGALDRDWLARTYGCSANQVRIFDCPNFNAFKISIPRPIIQGDLEDADMLGGQQFAPLLDLEVG